MADVNLVLLLGEDLIVTREFLFHLHDEHVPLDQLVRQASQQVPVIFLDRFVVVHLLAIFKLFFLELLLYHFLLFFQG